MRADELQVVIRTNEYCERCGAKNPFRKQRTVIDPSGGKMQYAKCRQCGASVKIFWSRNGAQVPDSEVEFRQRIDI